MAKVVAADAVVVVIEKTVDVVNLVVVPVLITVFEDGLVVIMIAIRCYYYKGGICW